jgi:hypothetical protein
MMVLAASAFNMATCFVTSIVVLFSKEKVSWVGGRVGEWVAESVNEEWVRWWLGDEWVSKWVSGKWEMGEWVVSGRWASAGVTSEWLSERVSGEGVTSGRWANGEWEWRASASGEWVSMRVTSEGVCDEGLSEECVREWRVSFWPSFTVWSRCDTCLDRNMWLYCSKRDSKKNVILICLFRSSYNVEQLAGEMEENGILV